MEIFIRIFSMLLGMVIAVISFFCVCWCIDRYERFKRQTEEIRDLVDEINRKLTRDYDE